MRAIFLCIKILFFKREFTCLFLPGLMKNILLICFFWMGLCRWHQARTQPMSMGGASTPVNISARYFSLTQGMPAQSVYGCVQDKQGFLWIATENGIARFDGFQFRRYGIQDGLPDLDVLNVCIDSTGRLWALPFQKPPVYYDASTDRFYMLPALAARDFRSYRAFILSKTELALSDIHGQIYVIDTRSREIIDSLNFQTLINQIVKLGVHRYGVLLSSTYL